MDKILILDGNADYALSLKTGLDKMRQFDVATAASGKEAIDLIEKNQFSVFVTEVVPPGMDALDLLAYMTQKRPNTPCIIMTDHGKPWYKKQMAQQSFLYHLEKPFEISTLASAIFVGLTLRDEGKNYRGMSMNSVLPLCEVLQKTCRMEVSSRDNGKGYLYFKDGIIIDAHYKDFNGEEAAKELTRWDGIFIKLSELPRCRNRTRIKTKLMDMAGASWDHQKSDKGWDACIEEIELTAECIQSVFDTYIDEFHRIKGFQALALIEENGQILASDQKDKTINLVHLTDDVNKFFSSAEKYNSINIDKGEAVTLHKLNSIVTILKPQKETTPRIRLIGVTSATGNWFFMKMNLKKLLNELVTFE
jgi:CheY-like chemotaxis protein